MKRRACLVVAALALLAGSASALTIRLGSLAPDKSPWDLGHKRIAAEWGKISGGAVTLKVLPSNTQGDETEMIRKMRLGSIDAVTITVSSLQTIFNGVKTLSYPLLIQTDAELAYVLGKMKPFFEAELEKKGFKVVMWSPGGWVYFFSRAPIVRPDDLRRQKLWVWSGDPDEVQAYDANRFQTRTVSSQELLTSLNSGMVDALVTSPLVALSSQWFGLAKNMCAMRLGPLWGATIVRADTWEKVPAEMRPRLTQAAQRIGDSIEPDLLRLDGEAITQMKSYGLTVNEVPPAARREWEDLMEKIYTPLVGRMYDRQSYELAVKYLGDYLAEHPRK
jgi:TRAP-type C4-dicarboxylate transport system substrate-binding protein